MAVARLVGVGVVECGVVRVHVFASDLASLYFQVAYAYYALGLVLRGLGERLRLAGYSAGFVERVRGAARALALGAAGSEAVVGCHGRRGCRSRRLLPLSYSEVLRVSELGVDVLAHSELPKIHVKVYTAESPYAVAPLAAWARS
jgi:hypothetical protein